ncbi:peptidoglycan DD-metalloendopeptidase family protein [Aliivibrio kagoshimensis]|uniref:peptidoglycan DD-metalloendopeptidase family protein n=1 Tax=Aliivibrio kagoshimensis TaxID=2910230 RepID=UPI003D128C5B
MRYFRLALAKTLRASTLCTGVLLCLFLSFSHSAIASNEELSGVKQEINRQQSIVVKQKKQLNQLQTSLKTHEVAISSSAQKVRQAQQALNRVEALIKELNQQQSHLKQQQIGQKETLKALLKESYMISRNRQLSGILSGEDSTNLDRLNIYAQSISLSRADAISQLEQTAIELSEKEQQLKHELSEQNKLLAQFKQQKAKLQEAQTKRKHTVSSIKKAISSDSSYLDELHQNEKRLTSEIIKAKARAKAIAKSSARMDGLASQKGRLPWPISLTGAKTLHNFGTAQTGQLTWKGMVIASSYGNPVKSVYSGKVVFADWLRGYGLMILVDHGKGDMTLYGYNQTLMKKVGDTVQKGETIALVGNSGGQDVASLYFEIRRNSKAQNPRSWLRK